MVVRVRRFYSNPVRSLGILMADDKLLAFTLELPKAGTMVRIPAGSYALALRPSPKFSPIYGHDMIEITGVPRRTEILVHPGDFEKDTHGCLLIGMSVTTELDAERDDEQLTTSRDMYLKVVYPVLSKAIKESFVDLLVEDADG
jgi:hypothetical protein